MFMYERWGWVLVFSLRRSSSPTFPIFYFFWFLSQNWVGFFGFSLKLHCDTSYKLVCSRVIGVRKGGKCQNEFLFSGFEGV